MTYRTMLLVASISDAARIGGGVRDLFRLLLRLERSRGRLRLPLLVGDSTSSTSESLSDKGSTDSSLLMFFSLCQAGTAELWRLVRFCFLLRGESPSSSEESLESEPCRLFVS